MVDVDADGCADFVRLFGNDRIVPRYLAGGSKGFAEERIFLMEDTIGFRDIRSAWWASVRPGSTMDYVAIDVERWSSSICEAVFRVNSTSGGTRLHHRWILPLPGE